MDRRLIGLRPLRNIRPNEKLTADYGKEWCTWQDRCEFGKEGCKYQQKGSDVDASVSMDAADAAEITVEVERAPLAAKDANKLMGERTEAMKRKQSTLTAFFASGPAATKRVRSPSVETAKPQKKIAPAPMYLIRGDKQARLNFEVYT
jgi:hypothetical protein